MKNENFNKVLEAIYSIKIGFMPQEEQIHDVVSETLRSKNIAFLYEYRLSPSARIDFISGDIGIEVKKSTVKNNQLIKQLEKYAQSDEISKIIVITTKSVCINDKINNKEIIVVNLNKNWSISL